MYIHIFIYTYIFHIRVILRANKNCNIHTYLCSYTIIYKYMRNHMLYPYISTDIRTNILICTNICI